MSPSRRGTSRFPFFLIYGSLAFALSAALLPFQYFIGHDGVWYARIGVNILAGKGIAVNPGEPYPDHPPLYPFLVGLANLFFKDPEFSGHFISILAFSLSLVPFFLLARLIYPGKTAHWASLLYATNGFLLVHSNMVLAESLFIFIALFQIFLTHRIIQDESPSFGNSLLLGFVAGAAFLTRPEALLFYGASVFSLLILSSASFGVRFARVLASLSIFLLLSLPWIFFVHRQTHRWQLSGAVTEIFVKRQMDVVNSEKYLEVKKIYQGLTEDKTRLKMDELKENFRFLDGLRKDRWALLRSGAVAALWHFLDLNRYLFGGLGFFFIGAGFFHEPWDSRRKKSETLLLLFFATVVPQFFGIFHPKRWFLYFPILLLWMGKGVAVASERASQSFSGIRKNSEALALGLCLFFVLPSAAYVHHCFSASPVPREYQEMGLWMKENLPHIEKERVASRHPSIIFYSGAKILNPPYLPYVDRLDDLLVYLKHQRARYFVIPSDLDSPTLDSYRDLLDETKKLPEGIRRVHTIEGKVKVALFEAVAGPE